MQGLFYFILFISISANFAALLDGDCNDNDRCQGENLICQKGKCRCDTPLYRPCNSSCEINPRISYEGDRCATNDHCLDNMRCSEQKCVCLQDYQARSQLCYKTLNKTCNNGTECWSGYCINAQCTCPVGYSANENGIGCRRKLVKIYRTLQEARPTEAFCSDSSSCYDPIAECHNESNTAPFKFCKCPQGFRVSDDNEKCDLVESPHFSPLTEVPSRYEECGTCKDSNAICMVAAQERTCWCRAGYRNENGRCVNDRFRPTVIFPNEKDRSKYDYTASCQTVHNVTGTTAERLCSCSSGYRFVAKDRICRKIELEWINDALEYGLCTHIDSAGFTTPENGLCPSPLTCQARRDKYVCSCGTKRFRDIDDPSQCVYYIGEKTENAADPCPTKNARRNGNTGICECVPGYKETNNRRQCKLELARDAFNNASCSNDRSNDSVCAQYGVRARLCLPGECRCDGIESFPIFDQQRCYAPLNVTLTVTREACPTRSTLQSSICRCTAGYYAEDRLTCARLPAQLVEYIGSPPSGASGSLRLEDCRALYSGPLQLYNGSRCQCVSTAFVRPDGTGCWYKLNVSLSGSVSNSDCPPHSARGLTDYCKCEAGYEQNQNECVLKKVELYESNSTTAVNTTGLTNADCTTLFGETTQISPGRFYCVCRAGASLTQSKLGCIYRIGFNDTVVKTILRCPEHAYVKQDGNYYTCLCKEGYSPSNSKETCETSAITLVGTRDRNGTLSNCVSYKDADCQVKFGLDAFCQNDSCYCNRRTSYINVDGQCEPVSSYVFPGLHEYQSHTCMVDKDCGDQENVVCAKLNVNARHKVCRCADGTFLDPKSSKCMSNRCEPPCNAANNFQCLGDQCICKTGYILNGNTCVINNYKLQLNERCNASASLAAMIDTAKNDRLMCDARCLRARCIDGFRPDEESCVGYTWDDACFNKKTDFCATISANAFCNQESNRCTCRPSFYQSGEECARAVNSRCVNDEDCGNNMRCETQRCQCNADQHVEDGEDVYGRPIQLCANEGTKTVKFSLALILLALIPFLK